MGEAAGALRNGMADNCAHQYVGVMYATCLFCNGALGSNESTGWGGLGGDFDSGGVAAGHKACQGDGRAKDSKRMHHCSLTLGRRGIHRDGQS